MVKFDDAFSMNNPQNEEIVTDDRISMIQTINGNVVQDFGYYDSGEKTTYTLQFDAKNKKKILSFWKNRKMVHIVDDVNHSIYGRILVKSYSYVDNFRNYVNVNLEIWKI